MGLLIVEAHPGFAYLSKQRWVDHRIRLDPVDCFRFRCAVNRIGAHCLFDAGSEVPLCSSKPVSSGLIVWAGIRPMRSGIFQLRQRQSCRL